MSLLRAAEVSTGGGTVTDIPLGEPATACGVRFDEAQLRDDYGRWTDDPSAIFRKMFKIRGNSFEVTAHEDGSRTLDFGAVGSVKLTSRELTSKRGVSLRGLAFNPVGGQRLPGGGWSEPWQVGQSDGLYRRDTVYDEMGNRTLHTRLLLAVKKTGEPPEGDDDEETWDQTPLSVHLPPNDDPSYDEVVDSPGVPMQQRDLVRLAEQADAMFAQRIDAGSGAIDVFRDGGRYVLRPERGPELRFDRKGFAAVDKAIDDLYDNNERPVGEVAERVVDTNVGPVTVRITGQGDRLEIETGGGVVAVEGRARVLDFVGALGELAESGSPERSHRGRRTVRLRRRAFDPGQPRDDSGRWADSAGGGHTYDQIVDLYGGEVYDEASFGERGLVVDFANGDTAIFTGSDGEGYTVLADGLGVNEFHQLADAVEWASSADLEGLEPSPNGLLDWTTFRDDDGDNGFLIGVDEAGDVRVQRNDGDYIDLSAEDAIELAEAASAMADRLEELEDGDVAAAGRAVDYRRRDFDPSRPGGGDGNLPKTGGALLGALEALGGGLDALAFDDGRYFDWSGRDGDNYVLEVGVGEDAVQLGMHPTEVAQVVSALTGTRLWGLGPGDPDPADERSVLLAALTAAGAGDAVYLNNEDDGERYLDWTTRRGDGSYGLEVGNADGEFIQLDLAPPELAQLHASLAMQLLHDAPDVAEVDGHDAVLDLSRKEAPMFADLIDRLAVQDINPEPDTARDAGGHRPDAGGEHTGAMVALMPSEADANRLVIGGGKPVGELHLTLWYLGDADAIAAETRGAMVGAIRSMVERRSLPVVEARGFGANYWNPTGDEPAWVLAVGDLPDGERPDDQERLAVVRGMISEAWHDGMVAVALPPQHSPWMPHICLAYSTDRTLLAEVAARVGPVMFDRVRVAFAGEHTDIPLTVEPYSRSARRFDPDQPRDPEGRWTGGGVASLWKKATKVGFHYIHTTPGQPASGFAVSPHPQRAKRVETRGFTANVLREYRDANDDVMAKKDHYVGLWRERDDDTGDDKVWMDVNAVYEDRGTAAEAARAAGQDTLFDLGNGSPVDVNGEGE